MCIGNDSVCMSKGKDVMAFLRQLKKLKRDSERTRTFEKHYMPIKVTNGWLERVIEEEKGRDSKRERE